MLERVWEGGPSWVPWANLVICSVKVSRVSSVSGRPFTSAPRRKQSRSFCLYASMGGVLGGWAEAPVAKLPSQMAPGLVSLILRALASSKAWRSAERATVWAAPPVFRLVGLACGGATGCDVLGGSWWVGEAGLGSAWSTVEVSLDWASSSASNSNSVGWRSSPPSKG
jgi:hypothetical protein